VFVRGSGSEGCKAAKEKLQQEEFSLLPQIGRGPRIDRGSGAPQAHRDTRNHQQRSREF
jgi:hypothetical protein